MNWTIISFQSVGPISFGQSRSSVRSRLGEEFKSFRKAGGENETDAYDGLGIHLYYDDEDCLEFAELFAPAVVEFQDIRLIGRSIEELTSDMRMLGYEGVPDQAGYSYDEVGLGLTVNRGRVEGVAVFKNGYYD
jgi:hypothetical protein